MSGWNEAQIKSIGMNLAVDLFEQSGYKHIVLSGLVMVEEVLDKMPTTATLDEIRAIIEVAKETVPQIGKEG